MADQADEPKEQGQQAQQQANFVGKAAQPGARLRALAEGS
jgi:hypothetical protein